jgi:hypothetical protein
MWYVRSNLLIVDSRLLQTSSHLTLERSSSKEPNLPCALQLHVLCPHQQQACWLRHWKLRLWAGDLPLWRHSSRLPHHLWFIVEHAIASFHLRRFKWKNLSRRALRSASCTRGNHVSCDSAVRILLMASSAGRVSIRMRACCFYHSASSRVCRRSRLYQSRSWVRYVFPVHWYCVNKFPITERLGALPAPVQCEATKYSNNQPICLPILILMFLNYHSDLVKNSHG